jgi:hypothetical protein
MGLPDITPGINTTIFFVVSAASPETLLLSGFFPPHPVSAKTAAKNRSPAHTLFLKNPGTIAASGVHKIRDKKSPGYPGLMFLEMSLRNIVCFRSHNFLPSGLYRRHRNFTGSVQDLPKKNPEVAGYTAGWE